ncbi:MAG TPA: glutamine synthetase family protein [Steroidobacteraceae bacterium]|nr:glutamine synthetase family protein [Steroidobacteraceae bacterium]
MSCVADFEPARAWLGRRPQVRYVDLLLADQMGIPRGKRVSVEELEGVYRDGLLLPASMFALDVLGGTVQSTGLGFDEGDADRVCLPIRGSLVPVPWLGEQVAQLQVSMYEHDRSPFFGDPRHVLEAVVRRYAPLGLKPVMAVELEFYLVDRERTPAGCAQPPRQPLTGRREYKTQINSMQDMNEYSAVLAAIDDAARAQELPTGTVLAEYGPGQFEVNLHHVDDPLLACDHAIRLKRLVKGVALQFGMEATFMPKPYRDHAGSGAHLHVSLVDASGRNVFASDDPAGSVRLRHAIGGLAATMNDAMAICAPTANSYRRFQPEAYVPLNPSWSVNNRGVAFRIPHGPPDSRRVEHRIAGADANPYLLAAIVLGGMHLGLEQQLDPGPVLAGNAYRDNTPSIPLSWAEALAVFEHSAFVRECLGERFARLYAQTRRGEMMEFCSYVPALDYDWYLTTS